jgi:hypothetical protein
MGRLSNAYYAGYFDGEGAIVSDILRRKNHKRACITIRVSVSSTHKQSLRDLHKDFGGYIYEHNMQSRGPNCNRAWIWRLSSAPAIVKFLQAILPYLRYRRVDAINGMMLARSMTKKYRRYINPMPDYVHARRVVLANKLRRRKLIQWDELDKVSTPFDRVPERRVRGTQ